MNLRIIREKAQNYQAKGKNTPAKKLIKNGKIGHNYTKISSLWKKDLPKSKNSQIQMKRMTKRPKAIQEIFSIDRACIDVKSL